MNIIVCLKQVTHIYLQYGYDLSTEAPPTNGAVQILNPCDENAVEAALRLRETFGAGSVTLITVGPPSADAVLRWGLAMGADDAIHIVDQYPKQMDSWTVATSLATMIKQRPYDLVLCGRQALDTNLGVIGAYVAELLDLPLVTAAVKIEISTPDSQTATVQRALERGHRDIYESRLPAVITVDSALNSPRYPTLPNRKRASSAKIRNINLKGLLRQTDERHKHPLLDILTVTPPRLRPRKILAPDSNASATKRIQFIMTGGMAEKKGGRLDGAPEKLAKGIFEFLREKGFLEKS